ncbi:spore germination protein, partial [Bacillus timonensis]
MTERHNNDNFPGYEKIKSILNESPDLNCRKIEAGQEGIHIIFMKNLIKPEILNEYVIKYMEELSVEFLHYTYLMKNIPIE